MNVCMPVWWVLVYARDVDNVTMQRTDLREHRYVLFLGRRTLAQRIAVRGERVHASIISKCVRIFAVFAAWYTRHNNHTCSQ